jgi:regulator of replication initiation timing
MPDIQSLTNDEIIIEYVNSLLAKIDALEKVAAEVAPLKSEIAVLKNTAVEVGPLKIKLEALEKAKADLMLENENLKVSLNKNSQTSSKPSSTDGFKRPVVNNREKSGNKPGGVEGQVIEPSFRMDAVR